MDWAPQRSMCDMMIISYIWGALLEARSFGKLLISHWFGFCGWREMLGFLRIEWKMSKTLWDLIHFYPSLFAPCTSTFKGISLNFVSALIGLQCIEQKCLDDYKRSLDWDWGDAMVLSLCGLNHLSMAPCIVEFSHFLIGGFLILFIYFLSIFNMYFVSDKN